MTAAVQARGLSLSFGSVRVLNHVDLDVPGPGVTALIGPSGCGKTTLLRCVNRLNERFPGVTTTGTLTVLGKNVYDADVSLGELRKRVGMVFQRPNPLPLSIYENVAFGLRVHAPGRSVSRAGIDGAVARALADVALWDEVKDRLRHDAAELSLAQQQKLCIARLLPLEPDVILMDEPCSALDARGTEAIEQLMARLGARFAILIVTHNMAQARRASDRCAFMLMGEVVEQAPTADLFSRPSHQRTALYVEGRYG